MGVSFDLNDTVVKIGRVFNTSRNTRLRDKCRKTEHYAKTGYLVHRKHSHREFFDYWQFPRKTNKKEKGRAAAEPCLVFVSCLN